MHRTLLSRDPAAGSSGAGARDGGRSAAAATAVVPAAEGLHHPQTHLGAAEEHDMRFRTMFRVVHVKEERGVGQKHRLARQSARSPVGRPTAAAPTTLPPPLHPHSPPSSTPSPNLATDPSRATAARPARATRARSAACPWAAAWQCPAAAPRGGTRTRHRSSARCEAGRGKVGKAVKALGPPGWERTRAVARSPPLPASPAAGCRGRGGGRGRALRRSHTPLTTTRTTAIPRSCCAARWRCAGFSSTCAAPRALPAGPPGP